MRFLAGLVAALIAACPAAGAQEASPGPIVWQLKNPFRYFKNADHTAAHREAFLALSEQEKAEPVLAVERKLAADNAAQGWAQAVFEHVEDEACWYAHPKLRRPGQPKPPGPCGAYIRPASHVVLVSAPTLSGMCTWKVADKDLPPTDCTKGAEATVPFGVKAEVVLSAPVTATGSIEVDDVLVVGLGDSFAAGEGNPDRPVVFKSAKQIDYAAEMQGYPQRADANAPAGWTHRTCHRSLYSHQLRVALQLAIEDPALHRSVTFIGLACTGATILDLFEAYSGRGEPPYKQDKPHASRKFELSPLSTVSHAICQPDEAKLDETADYNSNARLDLKGKPINIFTCARDKRLRTVDLLLLSVGGNDVGFSGLVANASLSSNRIVLAKLFEDPTITPDRARAYLKRLPGRYDALKEAMRAVLGEGADARVLLTAYPQVGFNEDGEKCPSGRSGFDVTEAWRLKERVIAETEQFVDADLMPAMEAAAQDAGWGFVKDVRSGGKFIKHGICAAGRSEREEPAWSNDRFPRYSYRDPVGWAPYRPSEFEAYRSRQRWVLTPNDAFMAVHFGDKDRKLPDLRVTSWSAYSGAFHPTAEGQAAIADTVLAQAREVLAKRVKPAP